MVFDDIKRNTGLAFESKFVIYAFLSVVLELNLAASKTVTNRELVLLFNV